MRKSLNANRTPFAIFLPADYLFLESVLAIHMAHLSIFYSSVGPDYPFCHFLPHQNYSIVTPIDSEILAITLRHMYNKL